VAARRSLPSATSARRRGSGGSDRGDNEPASPGAPAASTRLRLIEEAERLFAVRGFAGVSLREIGAAAGARNNSAAQYHFGSRDGLVDAVFDHRMAAINERRLALLAAIDVDAGADACAEAATDVGRQVVRGDLLRRLVGAMVVPLAEAYDPAPQSTYYARFSSQVMADPALVRSVASLERPVQAGLREVYVRIAKALAASTALPEPVIDQRLRLASTLFVRALADYEADRDAGMPIPALPFPQFVDGLVDAITALLSAPQTDRGAEPSASPTATTSAEGRHPVPPSDPTRPSTSSTPARTSKPSTPARTSKELP
jgi:AcrR family transcriptional regulator